MKNFLTVLLITSLIFYGQTLKSQTVYITKTGKKYHSEGCRSLSKSSIPININDAKKKGYTPCSLCSPDKAAQSTSKSTDPGKIDKKVQSTPDNKTNQIAPTESTKSVKTQCTAITKKGTRCSRMTSSPNGKCWQHGGD